MLTLRTLLEEVELELASGEEAADSPVRWVHITELPDPTPWLSGGELILTTGLQLGQRRAASARSCAGWPTTTWPGWASAPGFGHDALPEAMLEEARTLGFPVFEVPYDLPFIAVTEKAFARLVNEQYEVLQRGIAHPQAPGAAGDRGARPGRARPGAGRRPRRRGGGAGCPRRDAGRARLPARAARGALASVVDAVRERQAAHERDGTDAAEFAPEHPGHRRPGGGHADLHARARGAARRGCSRPATRAAWATSSG